MKPAVYILVMFAFQVGFTGPPAETGSAPGLTIPPSDIIFAHVKHVKDGGMDCLVCHSAAETSLRSDDKLYPVMTTCEDCHDIQSTDKCNACHRDSDNPAPSPNPERSILFSHKTHIGRGILCVKCHDGVGDSERPDATHMPTMALCFDCHDGVAIDDRCGLCHGDRISLNDIHPPGWRHSHGDRAVSERAWCGQCHRKESDCIDCHRGDNTLGNIHDLNYTFTHGLDAKSKEFDCARCHDRKSFCAGCHESENRIPLLHSSLGWLDNHGRAAKNDVENCASCHEAESPTCARTGCHRDADGVRGTDPRIHPSGLSVFSMHGPWHGDDGYYCYQCHTRTGQPGNGFCGYCHD